MHTQFHEKSLFKKNMNMLVCVLFFGSAEFGKELLLKVFPQFCWCWGGKRNIQSNKDLTVAVLI